MTFERLDQFSKKPTDLPDVPSPTYSAAQIKQYFQTPADELLEKLDALIDGLNKNTGAENIGAKLHDGSDANVQAAIDEKAKGSDIKSIQNQVNTLVINNGQSDAEVLQARTRESDGKTFDVLKDRLDNSDARIEITKSFNDVDFPRMIPEIADSPRIQRALNTVSDQEGLIFPYGKTYSINQSLKISSKDNPLGFHLVGYGVTLKAIVDGLNNTFDVQSGKKFSITGFKFDQNLQGRTSINCKLCTEFTIKECSFTGYTADYGWSTYDGGICCTDCYDYTISGNFWHQHGNQYDASTSTLNRCITIEGTSGDRARVINNGFYQVNQAIAIDLGSNNIIMGNTFEEVHDNALYSLNGTKGIVVCGNTFNDKYDECLVFSDGNCMVVGNNFRNSPNKFISINGDVDSLVVSGNTFDNDGQTTGSFIAYRDNAHTIGHLIVEGNIFKHPTLNSPNSYLFSLGNVSRLTFNNNHIDVNSAAYQKIMYFQGTEASGIIKNNTFIGADPTSVTIQANGVANVDLVYEDNEHINCRGVLAGVIARGHSVQTNVGPYILSKNKRREVYVTNAPTDGKWNVGDVAWNTTVSVGSVLGWICTTSGIPGVWVAMSKIGSTTDGNPRTRAGTPIGWLSPNYLGEMVIDTTTKNVYIGVIVGDQTNGWKLVS